MALTKTNLANIVEGTLPVANGGTGVTTSTGSGNNVLSTSPVLTTPSITSGSLTMADSTTITSGHQVIQAWVNFDGTATGTITPRASYNVTNITKVSTGVYTINITNALADANYCVIASVSATAANVSLLCNTQTNGSGSTAPSTTAVTISVFNRSAGAFADSPYINVQIIR